MDEYTETETYTEETEHTEVETEHTEAETEHTETEHTETEHWPQKLHHLLKFCPLPSFLVNLFEDLPHSDTSSHGPKNMPHTCICISISRNKPKLNN